MDGLVIGFMLLGCLAFMARGLLRSFVYDSDFTGTSAQKYKSVLLIIGAWGVFIVPGLAVLGRFYQDLQNMAVIVGIAFILLGIAVVWLGFNEWRHPTAGTKWANYLLLIGFVLFTLWQGFELQTFYQENGHMGSIKGLLFLTIGLVAIGISIRRIRSPHLHT